MMTFLALASRWFFAGGWKIVVVAAALATVGLWHMSRVNAAYDRGFDAAQLQAKKASEEYQKRVSTQIADIDKTHYTEKEKANAEIEKLRADIASGARRLSVPVRNCPAALAGSSMDNGATRAELDPATSDALIAITRDGDNAIRQLTAAQEIIKTFQATD